MSAVESLLQRGIKIVPTYHPAALLHDTRRKPVWRDFKKIENYTTIDVGGRKLEVGEDVECRRSKVVVMVGLVVGKKNLPIGDCLRS